MRKVRFNYGYNASRALVKKLAYNFFRSGKIVTTEKRAKVLKPVIEKLVEKTKVKNEANYNYLLFYFPHRQFIDQLFRSVGPPMVKTIGGYVRMEKMTSRSSDGARLVRMQWSIPVVMDETARTSTPVKEKKNQKINKTTDLKSK